MRIKTLLLAALLVFSFLGSQSQDVIVLKNGLTINGLITEVNSQEIKFRIDGGTITMDQVKSYQKGGQTVVNNSSANTAASQNNSNNTPKDCEIKNVGDVEFENEDENNMTVQIYAIGVIHTENNGQTNNPLVTEITVPAHSKATAFDLTTGVHYIFYYAGHTGSGQVRITKCGLSKYTIK